MSDEKEREIQADNTNLMPKSIRMTESTYDEFCDVRKAIGGNQQVAMATLLESWRLEQERNKGTIASRLDEITRFESYQKVIKGLFIKSLEECEMIRESVEMEHEDELKSKDKLISDLQKKVEKITEENNRFNEEKEKMETEISHLTEIKEVNESTISMLQARSDDYKSKYEEAYAQNTSLQERANRFESREHTLSDLINKMDKEKRVLVETSSSAQARLNEVQSELDDAKIRVEILEKENIRIEERLQRIYEEKLSVQLDRKTFEIEKELRSEYDEKMKALEMELKETREKYMNFIQEKLKETAKK